MSNIIVTGASSGIGFEMVQNFAQNPENKILAIARNKKKLENLQQICFQNFKNKVEISALDISDFRKEDNAFFAIVSSIFKKVDILINNAGLLKNAPFSEMKRETAQEIFNVNYFGTSEIIRAMLPLLKQATSPHVVNISSMGGFQGSDKFAGLAHYSASKAAIASLTECLAVEFKGEISFNALALGAAQTDMLANAFPGYQAPVSAKQMATFICNFAVNGNAFFNGKLLPVALTTP